MKLLAWLGSLWKREGVESPAPRSDAPDREYADLYARGVAALEAGRLPLAVECLSRATELVPDDARSHWQLGLAFRARGAVDDGIDSLYLAVAHEPGFEPARLALADALADAGRHAEVLEVLAGLATGSDAQPDVARPLARALEALGRFDEAAAAYGRAVETHPDRAQPCVDLGLYEYRRGAWDDALRWFAEASHREPARPEPHHDAGIVHLHRGDTRRAVECFRAALALDPGLAPSVSALGHAARDLGALDEALRHYETALQMDPGLDDAWMNRCYARLLGGDYARGWDEYERRFGDDAARTRGFPYREPVATQDVAGRRVLVYAEQGLGDEVMFASCMPDLLAVAGSCVIECSDRLAPLFARSFPAAIVHGGRKADAKDWLDTLPPIDLQIACGSLPRHFRRDPADFPRHDGYLRADPQCRDAWKARASVGGLRVGVSWRGGALESRALLRSVPLNDLEPVLVQRGAAFVSLQHGDCGEEIRRHCAGGAGTMTVYAGVTDDIDDLAALIASLDLVITVDNANAHLAGALGVPAWVMLSSSPEWRYGVAGDVMPWYPSMRLFRQTPGARDWQPVVERVAIELGALLASRGGR